MRFVKNVASQFLVCKFFIDAMSSNIGGFRACFLVGGGGRGRGSTHYVCNHHYYVTSHVIVALRCSATRFSYKTTKTIHITVCF